MSRDCIHLKTICFEDIQDQVDTSNSSHLYEVYTSGNKNSDISRHHITRQVNKKYVVATVQIENERTTKIDRNKNEDEENEGVFGRLLKAIKENDTIQNVIIPFFEPPEETKSAELSPPLELVWKPVINQKDADTTYITKPLSNQSTETDSKIVSTFPQRHEVEKQNQIKAVSRKKKKTPTNRKLNRKYERRKKVVDSLDELSRLIQTQKRKHVTELEQIIKRRDSQTRKLKTMKRNIENHATGIGDHEKDRHHKNNIFYDKRSPEKRYHKEIDKNYGDKVESSFNHTKKRKLIEELKIIEEREKSHQNTSGIASTTDETTSSEATITQTHKTKDENIKLGESSSESSQKLENLTNNKNEQPNFTQKWEEQKASSNKQDSSDSSSSGIQSLTSLSTSTETCCDSNTNKRSLSTIHEGSKESRFSDHKTVTEKTPANITKYVQVPVQNKMVTFEDAHDTNCQCREYLQKARERMLMGCCCNTSKTDEKSLTKIIYKDECENTCETNTGIGYLKNTCQHVKRKLEFMDCLDKAETSETVERQRCGLYNSKHLNVPSYLSPLCREKGASNLCPFWCPSFSNHTYDIKTTKSSENDLFGYCYRLWCQICFYFSILLVMVVIVLITFFVK